MRTDENKPATRRSLIPVGMKPLSERDENYGYRIAACVYPETV